VELSKDHTSRRECAMVCLRHLLGDVLRRLRLRQGRNHAERGRPPPGGRWDTCPSRRGQKRSVLRVLAAICTALNTPLSHVLSEVSEVRASELEAARRSPRPVPRGPPGAVRWSFPAAARSINGRSASCSCRYPGSSHRVRAEKLRGPGRACRGRDSERSSAGRGQREPPRLREVTPAGPRPGDMVPV